MNFYTSLLADDFKNQSKKERLKKKVLRTRLELCPKTYDQSNPVQGSDKMMKKRFERMKNLRKISKQYGERLSKRMIAKHKRKYTNQSYKNINQFLCVFPEKIKANLLLKEDLLSK